MLNKYGVDINKDDYVFLPLPFYNGSVWKVMHVEKNNTLNEYRVHVDEGNKHFRTFSINNPFMKLDYECGKILFENKNFEEKILEPYVEN